MTDVYHNDDSSCCDDDNEEDDDELKIEEEEEVSDEDDEYVPTPYIFTLKDIFSKPIALQPDLSENCKISCPPYYVLLDHTIAILWTIFSEENMQNIQTSHIHWAMKFLEGVKDKHNKQTDDVKIAISHLQDILIDMISNLDIVELEKRSENSKFNYSSSYIKSNKTDNNESETLDNKDFENLPQSTQIENGESADGCEAFVTALDDSQTEKFHSKLYEKEYPSFILEDLLGKNNPDKLKDIIDNTKHGTTCNYDSSEQPVKLDNTKPSCMRGQINEDILNWRENQYNKIIKQLQQMSQLDEAFKNINCSASSDIIKKLENFINNPEP